MNEWLTFDTFLLSLLLTVSTQETYGEHDVAQSSDDKSIDEDDDVTPVIFG